MTDTDHYGRSLSRLDGEEPFAATWERRILDPQQPSELSKSGRSTNQAKTYLATTASSSFRTRGGSTLNHSGRAGSATERRSRSTAKRPASQGLPVKLSPVGAPTPSRATTRTLGTRSKTLAPR